MKNVFVGTLLFVLLAVVGVAQIRSGWGKSLTATTTTQIVNETGFYGTTLSLVNNGAEDVFALVNCSTNTFNTRYAAGTTVQIPPGRSYTFTTMARDEITSLCYRTDANTSAILVAAY